MVSRSSDAAAHESLDEWASRLRAVLDERAEILNELERASADQEGIIESRDAARIMALLEARQGAVDRFVAGQPELLAMTIAMDERLAGLPATDGELLRSRMRDLSARLARLTERDESAQVGLARARDEARGEIDRAGASARARVSYAVRTSEPHSAFADQRG